eukprot:TRINITY_DN24023_c4_g1_i1.p1 TRINITY_DN24023_c4_g1~~TRINITY_DN24023_c4_g1_i1.p1  ORF type:complete len:249 (+),score=30.14 TRINITY_DN24023_c4_g1_i1:30-749(+)
MDSFDNTPLDTPGDSAEGGPGEDVVENPDVAKLIKRWRNEKYAPEILPFDSELIERLSEVLEFAASNLEEDRVEGDQDPKDPELRLRSLDLDRMRYVLRDYLRIRLWKLTQWPQHYLEARNQELLSAAERKFLSEYWDNKRAFLENRLLSALPTHYQTLDDRSDLLDMTRRPCLEKHIYARILGELGAIEVPPSLTQNASASATQEPLVLSEGETYLLRYVLVRPYLMQPESDGKVELV